MGDYGALYATDVKRSASNQVWFRYYISTDIARTVSFEIYDSSRVLVINLTGLGARPRGHYDSRSRAVFWDKRNGIGNVVAAGTYTVLLFLSGVEQDAHHFRML